MSDKDITAISTRIREARTARGMSAGELAEKIGVTRQAISKYELGGTPPPERLQAIAIATQMPIGFFYKPLMVPIAKGPLFFRSQKSNSVKAKEIMTKKSDWAIEIAQTLQQYLHFPESNVPPLPPELERQNNLSHEDIENLAKYVREFWKLGNGPIHNLVSVLEKNGIIIANIKTGSLKTDACNCLTAQCAYIFSDVEKECAVRNRFNFAHELGHIIMHQGVSQSEIDDKIIFKQIEDEANYFASCFLLPRESFLADIHSITLQAFLHLKQKWKVSVQAILYRCKDLQLLSETQYTYLQKQISIKKWRSKEPFDDLWPCEEPSILRTAIKMLLDHGVFTASEIVDLFQLPPLEIEQLCNLPEKSLAGNEESGIVINFVDKKRST